jgi:hypothetical protein
VADLNSNLCETEVLRKIFGINERTCGAGEGKTGCMIISILVMFII